jgi:hypothetical protein
VRTLTQTKFPFWSDIIILTGSFVSLPAGSTVYVEIRPPAGETWYITVAGGTRVYPTYGDSDARLELWDGTSAVDLYVASRVRITSAGFAPFYLSLVATVIITNLVRCRLALYNGSSYNLTGYYGYSGFKLSHPQWSPVRTHNQKPKPWRRPLSKPLPPGVAPLRRYAYDILGADPSNPDEYEPAIILEENTPLAIDPNTGQPVELLTVVVRTSVLADLLAKFKTGELDPVKAGYEKYLDKWKQEGYRAPR